MQRLLAVLIVMMPFLLKGQCSISASVDTIRACAGDPIQLNATGATQYTWTGSPNLSCTNCPNPVYTAQAGDTLIVSSSVNVNSFVTNGNFSQGNTGFTSNYLYNPTTIWNEGTYAVGPNPNAVHPNFGTWGDHTTGTGNYMLVNGSTSSNQNLWMQTMTLPAGSQVSLSMWFLTFVSPPGSMQIYVNNQPIGNSFTSPNGTGIWVQRTRVFTVPPSGVCNVRLTTLSSSLAGNDFGLDDIRVAYSCNSSDTVYVEIDQPPFLKGDPVNRIGCDSLCVQWTNNSISPSPNTLYWWDYGDGSPLDTVVNGSHCYSSSGFYNPVLYGETGLSCQNFTSLAPVVVVPSQTIRATPSDTIGCDTLCVQWTNTSGLDSNNFTFWWDYGDGSPLDTTFNGSHCYQQIGQYYPMLYSSRNDSFACSSSIPLDRINLVNSPVLSTEGVSGLEGTWSDSVFVISPANPQLEASWQLNPSSGNNQMTVDWGDGVVETLSENGGFFGFHQFPGPGLYQICSSVLTSAGCYDETCFYLDFWPTVELPNVFTPNGDGTYDEYQPILESTDIVEWAVYNRWGAEVFRTKDADQSWDGTSNGQPVAEGVYFVEIKFTSPYGGNEIADRVTLHLFR